jgi:hypothetical protein
MFKNETARNLIFAYAIIFLPSCENSKNCTENLCVEAGTQISDTSSQSLVDVFSDPICGADYICNRECWRPDPDCHPSMNCSCDRTDACDSSYFGNSAGCLCDPDCLGDKSPCVEDNICDRCCVEIDLDCKTSICNAESDCECDCMQGICDVQFNGSSDACQCDRDCPVGINPCLRDGHCDAWCPADLDSDCDC